MSRFTPLGGGLKDDRCADLEQDLKLGDEMNTCCRNPGSMDKLSQGWKREDMKLAYLQNRSRFG